MRPDFLKQIKEVISTARYNAVSAVNYQRVLMYWNIGRNIFEEEQQGKDRAEYGSFLIKNLAQELQAEFDSSFSIRQ